jgi:hypothetical protein
LRHDLGLFIPKPVKEHAFLTGFPGNPDFGLLVDLRANRAEESAPAAATRKPKPENKLCFFVSFVVQTAAPRK